jgi:hypothetical protein
VTIENQKKTIGLNIAATVGHLGLLLFLLITGIFEFYSSLVQSSGLNNLIYRVSTVQIIFISLTDLMICSVFWILTDAFEKTADKIRNSNKTETEENVESLVSSTRSFHELMNRDSHMIENPVLETVTLNNTNLYYEMITNQFIKEYLEESGRTQSTQARDSTLVILQGSRHESAEIVVRDQQRTSLQGTEPFEMSSQSSYNTDE